jgi:tetratricopeptide (TPR) repeat protein
LRLPGAIALFLCAVASGKAESGELQTLRVELKCENCGLRPEYTLELDDIHTHQKVESAELQSDGSFTLRHVPYGDYQLSILEAGGNALHQEFITVGGIAAPLVIHVTAPEPQRPPSGPVSVAQLQHPPTRKAFQAAQAAQKFSEAGDYEKAAEELQKAIRISPYYADAYTNLAAQHLRMGRYQEAAGELARALELGGPNPLVLTDMACTQVGLKYLDDAVQSARWALRLEPDYPQAHFILGMALSTDTRTVREGLEHLRKAAQTIPGAQVQIERVQRALVQVGR